VGPIRGRERRGVLLNAGGASKFLTGGGSPPIMPCGRWDFVGGKCFSFLEGGGVSPPEGVYGCIREVSSGGGFLGARSIFKSGGEKEVIAAF